jgi:hypothetical protein
MNNQDKQVEEAKKDEDYWTWYYQQKNIVTSSRPVCSFAVWFSDWLVDKDVSNKNSLLELGCGEGIETRFFASSEALSLSSVIGFDKCSYLVTKLSQENKLSNVRYVNSLHSSPGTTSTSTKPTKIGILFARFFIHSLNPVELHDTFQSLLMTNCSSSSVPAFALEKGALLALETRGLRAASGYEETYFKSIEGTAAHTRWLYSAVYLGNLFQSLGFSLVYERCAYGLAVYKNEDPFIIRQLWRFNGPKEADAATSK